MVRVCTAPRGKVFNPFLKSDPYMYRRVPIVIRGAFTESGHAVRLRIRTLLARDYFEAGREFSIDMLKLEL